MTNKANTIAIVTTILDDWGGSEELWAKCIPFLQEKGVAQVTVYRSKINFQHPEFVKLQDLGVSLKELSPAHGSIKQAVIRLGDIAAKIGSKLGVAKVEYDKVAQQFYQSLKATRPDLVIISQAINFDGLHLAWQCLKLKIPYVIISQKAVDFFWPYPTSRGFMKEVLLGAKQCFFVSEHNKTLTEEQFGIRLRKSQIVFNPVKTEASGTQRYPDTKKGYKLACVGRLFVIDKGQDILLRVLAQPKWRERNIEISFVGTGPDMEGIKEMAALLGVKNVTFKGQADSIQNIWAAHHVLVLPSRSEGLPLVIPEAMASGRVTITTNVGGNAEIIEHGVTGFLGEANEKDFEAAMEQAWERREEWEQMGLKAAEVVKQRIPEKPEKHFAYLVKQIMDNQ